MNVAHCPAVIVVFAMEGCPACEEYKPRLEREIRRWQASGAPFVFGDQDQAFTSAQIPVLLIDAQAARMQGLADTYEIEQLPTTILFRRQAHPQTLIGALDDRQIYGLLQAASGR